jgi:hypothetical protein
MGEAAMGSLHYNRYLRSGGFIHYYVVFNIGAEIVSKRFAYMGLTDEKRFHSEDRFWGAVVVHRLTLYFWVDHLFCCQRGIGVISGNSDSSARKAMTAGGVAPLSSGVLFDRGCDRVALPLGLAWRSILTNTPKGSIVNIIRMA